MAATIMETKTGNQALRGERLFWIILCANVISRFGDTIEAVACAWMVYAMTGSKVIMGSLLAVDALPNLLFAAVSSYR
jgi:DHA3 family macrolide efflux protein-like MFS transporter